VGHINENKDPIIVFLYLLFSVSLIYILGLGGLWNYMGFDKTFNDVFSVGAKPFLLIEVYKILILTVLSKQLIKIRKFI
jgi:biotin transport system substrate-specific component